MSRLWKWFTDRWPYYQLRDMLLKEDIPGGASFAYTLGSSLIMIFTLQIASGILQLFYYVPTVDHAYDSVSYLRTEVPFGWLIHNMHYWGAQAMVFIVAFHMMRVYIWGAYKKSPLTWFIGIALVLTVMALSFTGAPLIWDQAGYWAGEVGSSIAGEVPIVGEVQKIILRGGETMGQLALSRFFALHVGIFVPLLALLIGAHVASFRTSGVGGPWSEEERRMSAPLWPDQLFKDMITATTVFLALIVLSSFVPVPFTGAADTLNISYVPKPEWNFLFLYQALKYFSGPWEPVGAGGVPALFVFLLVIVPFIDRNPERNPFRRPVAMVCFLCYVGIVLLLTVIGYLSPGFAQIPATPVKTATQAEPQATREKVSPVPAARIQAGRQVFQSKGCTACHKVHGQGGSIGPELSGDTLKGKSRQWIEEQVTNPKSHFPNTVMPATTDLSKEQLDDLASYLVSLAEAGTPAPSPGGVAKESQQEKGKASPPADKGAHGKTATPEVPSGSPPPLPSEEQALEEEAGKAAFIIGSTANGSDLFKEQCVSCHGEKGRGGVPNPGSDDGNVPPLNPIDRSLYDRDPKVFAQRIDKMIQHGSMPAGPHPAVSMPAWGDSNSLTQQEISNLEAYIMQLNGIDRARLLHPGMEPHNFFWLVLSVYIIVILLLGGLRFKRKI